MCQRSKLFKLPRCHVFVFTMSSLFSCFYRSINILFQGKLQMTQGKTPKKCSEELCVADTSVMSHESEPSFQFICTRNKRNNTTQKTDCMAMDTLVREEKSLDPSLESLDNLLDPKFMCPMFPSRSSIFITFDILVILW